MTIRRLLCACAIGAAVAALAGCASHRPAGNRFVRTGEPRTAIGSDTQPKPPAPSLAEFIEKLRELSTQATPRGPEVRVAEQWNPELAAALAALQTGATAAAHRRVADAYRSVGILDAAHEHYSAAAALDNRDAAAFDGIARIWRDWGFPRLGLADAYRAVYLAPRSAVVRNTLGTVLYAMGRRDLARSAFEAAAALDPHAAYARTNICYAALSGNDLPGAARSCGEALAIDPTLTAARHNLAIVRALQGRFDLAAREFASGDATQAAFNMGIAYLLVGQPIDAAEAFDEAVALRPDDRLARVRAGQARRLAAAPGDRR